MVVVAQLVRAPDCGSGSRRFEPDLPPNMKEVLFKAIPLFYFVLLAFLNFICMFVRTIIVYTLFVMKNIIPKCGCGNTQNPNGYCDGSHAR